MSVQSRCTPNRIRLARTCKGDSVNLTPHTSLISRFVQWWALPAQRYLRWAVLASVVFHLALVFVHIGQAPRPRPSLPELEVVMVNAQSENRPTQPQVLAQANLDGGGDATTGIARSPHAVAAEDTATTELQALIRQRMQLEEEQRQLLEQLLSKDRVISGKPSPYFLDQSPLPGQDETDQLPAQAASTAAALADQVKQYNARPRRQYVAPSAIATRDAAYLDAWRQRIEQTGTLHYPKGVGKKLYGKVQVSVTIRADGSVAHVEIDQPSSEPLLNQAVRRIIQLASPFATFTPDMRKQVDELTITRTWHFVHGSLQTSP